MKVTPEELRRHAAQLDSVADRTGDAPAGPDASAYGQLCVVVPVLLARLQSPLAEALRVAAESVRGSAHVVRRAADGYQVTDETGGNSLHGGA